LVLVIRWLIGSDWNPRRIFFTHPNRGHVQIQRAFFQSVIRYEQSASGILIDRQALQRPVKTSPPFLRRQAKRYLEETFAVKPLGFSSKVSAVIVQMLSQDRCSADGVAMVLGVDRRTLARRLEREGESYASLLQRARCERVQQIVAIGVSLTDMAELAGFQSLSSFSRWFRATYGCSPTQWRQSARQSFGNRDGRKLSDTGMADSCPTLICSDASIGGYPLNRGTREQEYEIQLDLKLRRENRQLKLEGEILSKAAAWFAQENAPNTKRSSGS
jgi:AraC-like DNA-binding protein